MPTYQYRCPDCAHEFEARQAFSDDPVTTCPTEGCAGVVRKAFSSVGISFKGNGFYKNDHGSSAADRKSEQTTEKKTEQKDTSSGSGTGDSSTKDTSSGSNGSKDTSSDTGSKGTSSDKVSRGSKDKKATTAS
ncbi:MAG: FmdB family transcriptional regulator [Acidimicrobiaceae bacterium]|nr:FmdB family transcriptional regulator [Acidimicrobiaceae bacterium]